MSDRYYARITIGGPIAQEHKQRLAEEIDANRPWEEIDVKDVDGNGSFLALSACEVRNGEFGDLEELLEELGIEYDRFSGAYYDYSPCQKHFRPGADTQEYSLTTEGEKYFDQDTIRGIINTVGIEDPKAAVQQIRAMLTEEPEFHGMAKEMADYLLDVAENGLPDEPSEGVIVETVSQETEALWKAK